MDGWILKYLGTHVHIEEGICHVLELHLYFKRCGQALGSNVKIVQDYVCSGS